jgi:hypothetical protein
MGAMAVRSLLVLGGIVALVFAGPIACSKNERRNDDQGNGTSAAIKPDKEFAVVPFAQLNGDQKSRMLTVVQEKDFTSRRWSTRHSWT